MKTSRTFVFSSNHWLDKVCMSGGWCVTLIGFNVVLKRVVHILSACKLSLFNILRIVNCAKLTLKIRLQLWTGDGTKYFSRLQYLTITIMFGFPISQFADLQENIDKYLYTIMLDFKLLTTFWTVSNCPACFRLWNSEIFLEKHKTRCPISCKNVWLSRHYTPMITLMLPAAVFQ